MLKFLAATAMLLVLVPQANAADPPPRRAIQMVRQLDIKPSVPPNEIHTFTVFCPAGMQVTGGGFSISANDTRFKVASSNPGGPGQWRVDIRNVSKDTIDSKLFVYAMCL